MAFQSVGIVGAGAWGTALAITARRAGRDVLIWAYEPETLDDINTRHRNTTYLPGVTLDPGIEATARFNEVATCDVLLIVTPVVFTAAYIGLGVRFKYPGVLREPTPVILERFAAGGLSLIHI